MKEKNFYAKFYPTKLLLTAQIPINQVPIPATVLNWITCVMTNNGHTNHFLTLVTLWIALIYSCLFLWLCNDKISSASLVIRLSVFNPCLHQNASSRIFFYIPTHLSGYLMTTFYQPSWGLECLYSIHIFTRRGIQKGM